MALITDPDNLSQGTSTTVGDLAFTSSSGASTTLTGAATLPAIAANEYFEIRDSSTAGNNGLYRASGTPTTSSITCSKVDGPNPTNLTAESTRIIGRTSGLKSIHVDTEQKRIYLLEQGNLSTDGVTEQALYSFLKEEWKADADLIRYAFPITAITPEQFEYANGWEPRDVVSPAIQSKKLIRTGGWSELNTAGVMERQYVGVITLGSFEDNLNDTAYYQLGADPTDLASTNNFTFNGPVNEAILTYDNIGTPAGLNFQTTNSFIRSSGSFITDGFRKGADVTIVGSGANDGTYLLTNVAALYMNVSSASFVTGASSNALMAVDNRRAIKLFLRIRDLDTNGKTYSSSDLTAIGASSGVDNKVFRFPLSNATDLDISETDANIAANEPYTEVRLRYLPAAYNRDVDSSTDRNFGIIVDVGTFSHSQGASHSNSTFTWTSGAGSVPLGAGEALSDYTNGTLIIHEGSDQGTKTISGTPTDSSGTLLIPLSAGLTSTATNLSFTMQRATPIVASKTEIYEKIQYLLRQSGDIDSLGSVVSGKTADGLATFVGPDLRMGALSPANPNGGGSGVIIEGFSSNDTNNLFFFDNTGTSRNYPFVAAGYY